MAGTAGLGGRYLLLPDRPCSEMGAGAIGYVAMFEWFSHGGFSVGWWGHVAGTIGLIITITGYVGYRYRQTRALTLAQFFEMRYSRSFRFFTGILACIAGLLNFGVIPVIGGKFMVHFLDLPQQVAILSFHVPTYLILMGIFLTLTTYITITGGQITVMMADCIQGMISQVFYVIIGVALIITLNWHENPRHGVPGQTARPTPSRQPLRFIQRQGFQYLVRPDGPLGRSVYSDDGVAERLGIQRRRGLGA